MQPHRPAGRDGHLLSGTDHVTIVHTLNEKETVDEVLTAAGLRIERIDNSRVKVFEAERQ